MPVGCWFDREPLCREREGGAAARGRQGIRVHSEQNLYVAWQPRKVSARKRYFMISVEVID
jgi:hypothetical protein